MRDDTHVEKLVWNNTADNDKFLTDSSSLYGTVSRTARAKLTPRMCPMVHLSRDEYIVDALTGERLPQSKEVQILKSSILPMFVEHLPERALLMSNAKSLPGGYIVQARGVSPGVLLVRETSGRSRGWTRLMVWLANYSFRVCGGLIRFDRDGNLVGLTSQVAKLIAKLWVPVVWLLSLGAHIGYMGRIESITGVPNTDEYRPRRVCIKSSMDVQRVQGLLHVAQYAPPGVVSVHCSGDLIDIELNNTELEPFTARGRSFFSTIVESGPTYAMSDKYIADYALAGDVLSLLDGDIADRVVVDGSPDNYMRIVAFSGGDVTEVQLPRSSPPSGASDTVRLRSEVASKLAAGGYDSRYHIFLARHMH